MPQRFRENQPPLIGAREVGVRALIANDQTKRAVENAKEIHKEFGTSASEALLVDAYMARIQSLKRQNLMFEAKSLLDMVMDRFPRARARTGSLDELLGTLTDPQLSDERRSAIEQIVQRDVRDLAAIAGSRALPESHPLRQAAAALQTAFAAVTAGPVTDGQMALPEISRRSPLAPWKLLIRAIGWFYRQEDDRCREFLDGIPPESAAARLVPAMRKMLGAGPATPLGVSAARLAAEITEGAPALRSALEKLDELFNSDAAQGLILKAVKAAVEECGRHCPDRLETLKQHIAVRCSLAELNEEKTKKTLGGGYSHDAYFWRLMARGMEQNHDPETVALACALWEEFRQSAVREGWFTERGPEAATLYLHMADVVRRLPDGLVESIQTSARVKGRGLTQDEATYFFFPEQLYERACALDPHFEGFSQWMAWAKGQRRGEAERVAETWHRIRPADIEPILHLMDHAAKKTAFPTALKYLVKAERIDGVHPAVRRARLRLLAGSAIKHIRQTKAHLANDKIAEMAELPQTQQGDRPAFLAALRYLASSVRDDGAGAAAHRAEVDRLLGNPMATSLLIFGTATAAKRGAFHQLPTPDTFDKTERGALPVALARVVALAADMNAMELQIPWTYISEAATQLARSSQSLDVNQLRLLAESGVCARHSELAYGATAAGLEHGGATEARFLLLRAKSLPPGHEVRRGVCAAAAAELARQQRDMQLVEQSVELVRAEFGSAPLALSPEQVATVVKQEKAAKALPGYPGQGPNYDNLLPKNCCMCAACRHQRGEPVNPYELEDDCADEDLDYGLDEEMEELFDEFELPPGMPPEIARMLFAETKRAALNGESLDDLMKRILNVNPPGRRGKKGRRR